jgi:hypothetical protein
VAELRRLLERWAACVDGGLAWARSAGQRISPSPRTVVLLELMS